MYFGVTRILMLPYLWMVLTTFIAGTSIFIFPVFCNMALFIQVTGYLITFAYGLELFYHSLEKPKKYLFPNLNELIILFVFSIVITIAAKANGYVMISCLGSLFAVEAIYHGMLRSTSD